MVTSAFTHPCDTNTFTHSLTRIHLMQLKIHNIWMKFFWNQKVFHLAIKEISTLKSLYKLFLIKLSADISDSSFVLDSLLKAKIFPNFSAGNIFYFLTDFEMQDFVTDVILSVAVSFVAWKTPIHFQFFCFIYKA